MTQSDLLELAKQGDPQAIAALLARQFQPKGITVTATLQEECLYLAIAASKIPKQTTFSNYLHQSLGQLTPQGVHRVEISGYKQGDSHPSWREEFSCSVSAILPDPPSPIPLSTASLAFLGGLLKNRLNSPFPSWQTHLQNLFSQFQKDIQGYYHFLKLNFERRKEKDKTSEEKEEWEKEEQWEENEQWEKEEQWNIDVPPVSPNPYISTPFQPSSISQKPLWRQWIVTNIIGGSIFLVLQQIFLFLGIIPSLYRQTTVGLFCGTLTIALAQSALLQKRLSLGGWWIPATLGGLGVGATSHPFLPPPLDMGVGMIASILMQWWVLRKSIKQDLVWIWGNLLGLVAGVGIASGVGSVLISVNDSQHLGETAMVKGQFFFAIALGFLIFSGIQSIIMGRLLRDRNLQISKPDARTTTRRREYDNGNETLPNRASPQDTPKRRNKKTRSRQESRFATLWGLTMTLGFFLFVTLADMGGSGIDALLGHGFYGCIIGLVAGGLQSLLLQPKLVRGNTVRDRWILATTIGYALFFGLSGLVGMALKFLPLFLALGGAIVGTLQWRWVLWKQLPRSHWWIVAMSLGGLLTGFSRNGLSGGLIAGGMMIWLLQSRSDLERID